MEIKPKIEYGSYFHIYNRGINSCNIFNSEKNYSHFLNLYKIYINSIAETFSWCLMPNHFHLLLKIKEKEEIEYLIPENKTSKIAKEKWETFIPDKDYTIEKFAELKKPVPEKQFSHLFNAYSKAFNKSENRTGKLFDSRFERIEVRNEKYLKNLILYIHFNPVNHGFSNKVKNYKWTSYHSIISNKPTKLMRKKVIEIFEDIENFMFLHDFNNELYSEEKFPTKF